MPHPTADVSIAQTHPLAAISSSRKGIIKLSALEKRRITIWEQMREIEGELFLLSARSGESDFENGHRFKRLCGKRAKLANELLLYERR